MRPQHRRLLYMSALVTVWMNVVQNAFCGDELGPGVKGGDSLSAQGAASKSAYSGSQEEAPRDACCGTTECPSPPRPSPAQRLLTRMALLNLPPARRHTVKMESLKMAAEAVGSPSLPSAAFPSLHGEFDNTADQSQVSHTNVDEAAQLMEALALLEKKKQSSVSSSGRTRIESLNNKLQALEVNLTAAAPPDENGNSRGNGESSTGPNTTNEPREKSGSTPLCTASQLRTTSLPTPLTLEYLKNARSILKVILRLRVAQLEAQMSELPNTSESAKPAPPTGDGSTSA